MSRLSTAYKLLISDRRAFLAQLIQLLNPIFSDKRYLELQFRLRMGYPIDWNNPKTYNEKLNWLKLYDHNPLYTKLVNKDTVKSYVANIIGAQYLIPTIAKWNTPKDVNLEILPDRFVIKTTHGGGNEGVYICKDKSRFDKIDFMRWFDKAIRQDLYKSSREWPYKNVPKQLICEPYIEDMSTGELRDYKFFCFDGEVKALFVATERQKREEPFFTFFDQDYNPLPIKQGHPVSPVIPQKPACFDEMKKVASTLSQGLTHVRVDLYEANSKVYFGEMTFYHFGAVVPFEPREWDLRFGEWIKLHF